MYFWLPRPTTPLCVRSFQRKKPVKLLVLFSKCSPTGLMSMGEVPIDPEIMVVIEGLVYSVRGKSVAQMCGCAVCEEYRETLSGVERCTRVSMRAPREF